MARLKQKYESNGFFGIGALHIADEENLGTLMRSAFILGASFIFTVDKKYKPSSNDVTKAWSKISLYHYESFDDLLKNIPHSTQLVGVELSEEATPIGDFEHPTRAIYLLGSENVGLPPKVLNRCHSQLVLPGNFSLNLAVAGSIVAHHRYQQLGGILPKRG